MLVGLETLIPSLISFCASLVISFFYISNNNFWKLFQDTIKLLNDKDIYSRYIGIVWLKQLLYKKRNMKWNMEKRETQRNS